MSSFGCVVSWTGSGPRTSACRGYSISEARTAPAPEQLAEAVAPPGLVVMSSPVEDKLALYADRFRARPDAYAVRWEKTRTGVTGRMPAAAVGWRVAQGYGPAAGGIVAAHG